MDLKYAKYIFLIIHQYKLDKLKTLHIKNMEPKDISITQALNVQKVNRGNPKSYLDVLDNLEYWHIKRLGKILYVMASTGGGATKHKKAGTIDGIYMTHSPSKHYD